MPSITMDARIFAHAGILSAALALLSSNATAQAIEKKSTAYWVAHVGATSAAVITGAVLGAVFDEPLPPNQYPPPRLWAVSDALYSLDLILPLPALATSYNTNGFGHSLFVYGETLAGGYLLNNLARSTGYGGTGAVLAFGSATIASQLFKEAETAPFAIVDGFWGVEFALATASTILRYRGTHPEHQSPWQYGLESAAGIALGTAVYTANGGHLKSIWHKSWGASLAGVGLGAVVGLVIPSDDPSPQPVMASLEVLPFVDGVPGLSVSGAW